MSFQVSNNLLPASSLAALHLFTDNEPSANDSPKGFLACIERIFTVFWNAIKDLIAQIQTLFQRETKPETENPLETKTIKAATEPAKQKNIAKTEADHLIQYVNTLGKKILEAGAKKQILNENETPVKQTVQDKPKSTEDPAPQPAVLTAYEREHRIRKGAEDIQARLDREWQHAQNQMARELNKEFVYEEASKKFKGAAHEERIGNYQIGLCHYIGGYRYEMEDEHLARTFNLTIARNNYVVPLFAIMDGHGGKRCAQFVRDNLQQILHDALQEFNPQGLTDEGIWNALKHTGVRLHERFCAQYYNGVDEFDQDKSGTTLVFSMILNGKLWTANVGDSRAILSNNGKASQLSEDAKPADPDNLNPEITRYNRGIIHRGGTVEQYGGWRINGRLACGRSIGDPHLNGANSARSKITMRPLTAFGPNSFLILGCDGIYDVSSTQQIVDAVHSHSDLELGPLARNIVYSTDKSGSKDNQSLMIVKLT